MTGADCFSGHFRCALALSVALHLLFAAVLTPEFTVSRAPSGVNTVITVQLVALPAAVMAENWGQTRLSAATGQRKKVEKIGSDPIFPALPAVVDSTYYTARDLDVYPRPVAPLELDRVADGIAAPGRIAVILQIDEQGTVSNVVFTGMVAPDELKERLRTVLAATRFLPARKDGRAVRSRLTLSVDFH